MADGLGQVGEDVGGEGGELASLAADARRGRSAAGGDGGGGDQVEPLDPHLGRHPGRPGGWGRGSVRPRRRGPRPRRRGPTRLAPSPLVGLETIQVQVRAPT